MNQLLKKDELKKAIEIAEAKKALVEFVNTLAKLAKQHGG